MAHKIPDMTSRDATHRVRSRHCIGAGPCREYHQPRVVLTEMGGGRLKLLVFGDGSRPDTYDIRRIRYVEGWRVVWGLGELAEAVLKWPDGYRFRENGSA